MFIVEIEDYGESCFIVIYSYHSIRIDPIIQNLSPYLATY